MPRLNELEAQRVAVEAALPRDGKRDVVMLHPSAVEAYRGKVAEIHEALTKGDDAGRSAVALVRELIDRIVATPAADGYALELFGNIVPMLAKPTGNNVCVNGGCGGQIWSKAHTDRVCGCRIGCVLEILTIVSG